MSEVKLLPLPEPDHVGGNDVFGKEFPLFTTEQAEAYARANVAYYIKQRDAVDPLAVLARAQEAEAENERLREEFEFQAALTKDLLPYQERAVKAEARAEQLESRCHALAEALRILLGGVDDLTSYAAEDDEIGHRPCCNVLSYKEHTDDCAITQARAALEQEGGND